MFPDADVQGVCSGYGEVKIINVETNTTIAAVSQRDLFRKYRWPAAGTITKKLQMFKETMED